MRGKWSYLPLSLRLYVEVESEAVVGKADVRRQGQFGGGVVEVVGHVGEEGATGRELVDQGDRFFQVGVAGVGLAAERVEDEDVEMLEERDGLGRKVGEVSEIGGGAEAVAGDGLAAVGDGDTLKVDSEERNCAGGGGSGWMVTRAEVG